MTISQIYFMTLTVLDKYFAKDSVSALHLKLCLIHLAIVAAVTSW